MSRDARMTRSTSERRASRTQARAHRTSILLLRPSHRHFLAVDVKDGASSRVSLVAILQVTKFDEGAIGSPLAGLIETTTMLLPVVIYMRKPAVDADS